jgi:hypothetical protein
MLGGRGDGSQRKGKGRQILREKLGYTQEDPNRSSGLNHHFPWDKLRPRHAVEINGFQVAPGIFGLSVSGSIATPEIRNIAEPAAAIL